MDAVKVIENLIKVGLTAADAAGKDTSDWREFMDSDAYKGIKGAVEKLVKEIQDEDPDLTKTIARLQQKQKALLGWEKGSTVEY